MSYPDFKNENEVKEYLENLYTEYKFGCCSEKKPEVCHLLGDYEEGIKTDFKKASEIYKNNCDQFNYGRSCSKFAGYKFYGKGCTKDTEVAYNYFKKACEVGDGKGCTNFGVLSTDKDFNINKSNKKEIFMSGIEALKKSCYDYKEEKGCFILGSYFISGIEDIMDKNFKEGYKAMLLSCEYTNPYACANISQMHSRGEGAEKNEELAKVFKERAIDLYNQMVNNTNSIDFQQGIK